MGRIRGIWVVTMGAVLCAGALPASARDDYHLAADPARRVYQLSPFAHGYVHGYEDGFYLGDEDLHMARVPRSLQHSKESRRARGYESRFGDKDSYREGYRQGMLVGYQDAISGGEFRAITEIRRLAAMLSEAPAEPLSSSSASFDRGFLEGYQAARSRSGDECSRDNNGRPPAYCSGYRTGFRLGEADGGVLQNAAVRQLPTPVPPESSAPGARQVPGR